MLKESRRPLTADEIRNLQSLRNAAPHVAMLSTMLRIGAASTSIVVVCGLVIAKAVWFRNGMQFFWTIAASLAAVVGTIGVGFAISAFAGSMRWLAYAQRFHRAMKDRIDAAVSDGHARVHTIESDHALIIDSGEPASSACIVDLGNGTSLFLVGGDKLPDNEPSVWPAKSFEWTVANAGGVRIRIDSGMEPPQSVIRVPIDEMPESFRSPAEPLFDEILSGRPQDALLRFGHRSAR